MDPIFHRPTAYFWQKKTASRHHLRGFTPGFTLVELLVVIGIIALLISILLPALNKARQASQRTACSAKLEQMMVAAGLFRAEHRDYYPLAGELTGGNPEDFNDTYTQKYVYWNTGPNSGFNAPANLPRGIASITVGLRTEMGFKFMLYDTDAQENAVGSNATGLTQCFFCPSQATNLSDFQNIVTWNGALYSLPATYSNYTIISWSSYLWNEYVVGYNDPYGRLEGHATMVHKPTQTFFACDGLPQNGVVNRYDGAPYGMYTIYNNFPLPHGGSTIYLPNSPAITLADVFTGASYSGITKGGSPSNFDLKRHQGKINVAFCDGHVETRTISAGDLQSIFLVPP